MGAMTVGPTRAELAAKADRASKALSSVRGEANSPISPGNIWDDMCALGGGLVAGASRGMKEAVGPVPTDAAIALVCAAGGVGWGSDSLVKVGVGAGSYALGRWAESMVQATKEKRAANAAS